MCLTVMDAEYHKDRELKPEMSFTVWGHFQAYQMKKKVAQLSFL